MDQVGEYRKAIENQIAMIEEILSRYAEGNRTWDKPPGAKEWRETTAENIQRHEANLSHFRAEREKLAKAKLGEAVSA
jgi:hypothetical protein